MWLGLPEPPSSGNWLPRFPPHIYSRMAESRQCTSVTLQSRVAESTAKFAAEIGGPEVRPYSLLERPLGRMIETRTSIPQDILSEFDLTRTPSYEPISNFHYVSEFSASRKHLKVLQVVEKLCLAVFRAYDQSQHSDDPSLHAIRHVVTEIRALCTPDNWTAGGYC